MVYEQLLTYTPSELFYSFFLPFIFIFALLWGLLSLVKLFDRKVNLVIALAATIAISTTETFIWITTYFAQITSYFAIVVFFGIFIIGIALYFIRKTRGFVNEGGLASKRFKKTSEEIEKLWEKYDRTTDEKKKEAIYNTIKKLEDRQRLLERELRKT